MCGCPRPASLPTFPAVKSQARLDAREVRMTQGEAVTVGPSMRSRAMRPRVGLVGLLCGALLVAASASRPAAAAITFVQEAKVTAADAGAEDRFGVKVAIDGDTLVV